MHTIYASRLIKAARTVMSAVPYIRRHPKKSLSALFLATIAFLQPWDTPLHSVNATDPQQRILQGSEETSKSRIKSTGGQSGELPESSLVDRNTTICIDLEDYETIRERVEYMRCLQRNRPDEFVGESD